MPKETQAEQANPQPGADLHTAADRIGDLFVKETETPEAEQASPEQEVSQKVEETQQEPQESQEADNEPQEAESEEEQAQFESLDQFAQALDMPFDDFMGNIKAKVKISGVERDVTLAELRDGYQMEADYRRKTSELAEQRKAFEAERGKLTEELTQRYTEAQQLTGLLEQSLMAEFNTVDWNGLRQSDPAEFAAKKQEYNDRYAQIQQMRVHAVNEIQQHAEEQQREQTEQYKETLKQEQEKLVSFIPEFGNEAKRKALVADMNRYMTEQGFTDAEINGIYDHRQILVIRDAMAYRDLKTKQPEVKNKVIKAPKFQKPGSGEKPNQDKVTQQLRNRLKKSGRVEDAAALIKL